MCRRRDGKADGQEPCRLRARIGNKYGLTLCADGIAGYLAGGLSDYANLAPRRLKERKEVPRRRRDRCGVAVRFSVNY